MVQGVCSYREAAVTAQQLAAYPSSPVVSVVVVHLPVSSSLIPSVLCPVSCAAYICGVCFTCHPSSPSYVITSCIKRRRAKPRPLEQLHSCIAQCP